jgi:proteasome lid subunit RPN8/RPN11
MARRKYRIRKKDIRYLLTKAVAEAKDAHEICGLLIDNGYFLQLMETRNISKRDGSFLMDGREVRSVNKAAEKLNLDYVGTYHSHICWFAKPGDSDIAGAEDNSLMLIIDNMDKEVKLWRIKNKRAYPLSFEII